MKEKPFWVMLKALLKNNVLSRWAKHDNEEMQITTVSMRPGFLRLCIGQSWTC
jgi:hypothetical protein